MKAAFQYVKLYVRLNIELTNDCYSDDIKMIYYWYKAYVKKKNL